MSTEGRFKCIRSFLLITGIVMVVVGVILLGFSFQFTTVGSVILSIGAGIILIYLLTYFIQVVRRCNENPATLESRVEDGHTGRENMASNSPNYAVPSYAEVVGMGTVQESAWTSTETEAPPSYDIVSENHYAAESTTNVDTENNDQPNTQEVIQGQPSDQENTEMFSQDNHHPVSELRRHIDREHLHLQLDTPPILRRINSDIHDLKGAMEHQVHLEPLTPPPLYEDILNEGVFQSIGQPP
ncbi:uncharacterized protein LOC122808801 [Protopterus annectens]|uniref:uncharacterized protein LOC122808801 n=1 Tax=Protopterus annectens TaxID=7888 RepID=UPI001CFB320A|nr:uncharacterized protein LOC122808801 [Protopterus annectens]